ncbi:MAG TPA: sigma-70 family RNA polymerase sigma factor [Pseudoduganella sp.]
MPAFEPDTCGSLWQRFWFSRDPALRLQLVEHYLDYARIMAGRLFAMRVHAGLEFADYLQFAREGLLQAVDRFEQGHGAKFETFAAARINGAIIDGIRSYSEVQSQAAARKRILAQRAADLAPPAPAPGDTEALFGQLAEMAVGLAVGFILDDSGMYLADEPSYPDNAYAGVELRQLRQRLQLLLHQLTERQRQVLHYHYLQQLPFETIADMLGLSKGRISQLHREALDAMRRRMLQEEPINLRC